MAYKEISNEEIIKQGEYTSYVHCEDCDYETDSMPTKDLIFKLSMEGGYIVSDQEGGYYGLCPKCQSENLCIDTD